MDAIILGFATFYGITLSVWGSVGIIRFATERARASYSQRGVHRAILGIVGRSSTAGALTVSSIIAGLGILVSLMVLNAGGILLQMLAGVLPPSVLYAVAAAVGVLLWGSVVFASGLVLASLQRSERSLLVATWNGTVYWLGFAYQFVPVAYEGAVPPRGIAAVAASFLITSVALSWAGYQRGLGRGVPGKWPLRASQRAYRIDDVAVLVSARNEEKAIPACITALRQVVPLENVFVASDGSTDRTARIVREMGCRVLELPANEGKARALRKLLDFFGICDHYKIVLILDADSEIDQAYMRHALPLFRDPSVVAVAGHVIPKWRRHFLPSWSMFFVAYRVRLYRVLQATLRYGQTWKYANVSFIIPGFASLYRADVLRQIDVAAPGLIIEDFNMTFELHRKKLGKIAYSPKIRCLSQDPICLTDYTRQLRRWNLGFWQTVLRNGIWPSLFWLSLGVFIVELAVFSVFVLSVPFVIAYFYVHWPVEIAFEFAGVSLTPADIFAGVVAADYLLTVLVAAVEFKPILLIYGFGFVVLRWIDAAMYLYGFLLAVAVRSDGRWVSPERA